MKVLIVAEHRSGALREVTPELVSAARSLAGADGRVVAVVIGKAAASLSSSLALEGLDEIKTVDAPVQECTPEAYRHAVVEVARRTSAGIVLVPHTVDGMSYASAVALALPAAFASDVVAARLEGDALVVERQLYGGKITAELELSTRAPVVLTVRPAAFEPAPAGAAAPPVEALAVDFGGCKLSTQVLGIQPAAKSEVDLTKAKFIVAAGRGFQEKQHIPLAASLAERLGATLAASRPVVDAGWLPRERQVGNSGQSVAPSVYFAIGISGTTQHVAGMRRSECIVALNVDPGAAIFEIADVGIVGDLFEVIPAIMKRLDG